MERDSKTEVRTAPPAVKAAKGALFMLLLGLILPTALLAQQSNRAALVVSLEDGQVMTRCVAFSEPQISGYDLLVLSGLAIEVGVGGVGTSVCRIEGTGCSADDCFCQCRGESCRYWSYWHQLDGEWQYAQAGAALYEVSDGAVEGWTWGPGSVTEVIEPPPVSFAEICPTGADDGSASAASDSAATGAVSLTGVAPQQSSPETSGANQWPLYALFALIVASMVGALIISQRRRRKGEE